MQTINKVELTDSELEALYAERQNAKRKQAEEKRDSYESLRHQVVTDSVKYAVDMYETMKTAHGNIMSNMLGFRELMNEFGDLPKNSQGGFSILNKEGNLKTILKIRKIGEFDERADLAEQHIRIFLEKEIKASSPDAYDMILALLERKKGKLEYSRVMTILQYESRFTDQDWKKGCELLKESFRVIDSKYYLEFEQRDENGVWQRIDLNFASFQYKTSSVA